MRFLKKHLDSFLSKIATVLLRKNTARIVDLSLAPVFLAREQILDIAIYLSEHASRMDCFLIELLNEEGKTEGQIIKDKWKAITLNTNLEHVDKVVEALKVVIENCPSLEQEIEI